MDKPSNQPEVQPDFKWMLQHPARIIALGFGSGLAPIVPGTFGTMVALPIMLALSSASLSIYLVACVVVFGVGVWAAELSCRHMGAHDHNSIVWDEVAGYMVTMILLPMTWQWLLAGFILFRLVDILKPWPINLLDRNVHGGFGVMIDDIAAGVVCCIALHIVRVFFF